MNIKTKILSKARHLKSGFALIATISIMVLLVMVALAMLTLSTVELKSAANGNAMEIARSNARMALIMAIGELQAKAGLDTRVTAPAEAVAGVNGPQQLTGVWRSWEGNDHDKLTGLPIAPNYGSKLDTGDLANSSNEGRFLGWLISGPDKDNDVGSPPSLEKSGDTKPLLAEGTLGVGSNMEVHLVPTEIDSGGFYAWWVQGENVKAFMKPKEQEPVSAAEWSQRLASNGRPDTEEFGFQDDTELAKAVTRKSTDLMSNSNTNSLSVSGEYFHHMTASSIGLLTNTANGGWRRDLSLMSENWSNVSSSIPVFSLSPGVEYDAAKTIASSPNDGSIYPWADVDNISMSWNALVQYLTLYKNMQSDSSGNPYIQAVISLDSDNITYAPTPAGIQYIFYYSAIDVSPNVYTPKLRIKVATKMWNPYNVALNSTQNYEFSSKGSPSGGASDIPFVMSLTAGGETRTADAVSFAGRITTFNTNITQSRIRILVDDSENSIFNPGEVRIYGSTGDDLLDVRINTSAGYDGDSTALKDFARSTTDGNFPNTSGPYSASIQHNSPTSSGVVYYIGAAASGDPQYALSVNETDSNNLRVLPTLRSVDLSAAVARQVPSYLFL